MTTLRKLSRQTRAALPHTATAAVTAAGLFKFHPKTFLKNEARSDDFEEISDRDEPTVDDGATNRSRLFGNLAPGADVRRLLHSPPEAPGAVHEAPTPPELPKVRAAPLMDRRPITLRFREA